MEKKRATLSDYFKYKNIRDYVQGTYNYFFKNTIEQHKKEQAFHRALLCKPCLNAGSCEHCGCATPHLFFAPNKTDAGNKWGVMLEAAEWEEYKKENNINIDDTEKNVIDAIKQNNTDANNMLEESSDLIHFPSVPEYTDDLKEILKDDTKG